MSESKSLSEFLAFVAQRGQWKPKYNFSARVARMAQAPTFAYTLPLGEVLADPDWLVFLTLSNYVPGKHMNLLREFVQGMKSQYETVFKLNEWTEDPLSLVHDVAKWLSKAPENENQLAQALLSPNSTFVPFNEITKVEFKKGIVALRPHHMQLTLKKGGLVIYQDPATENAFKSLFGQFSGKWQPEFFNRLESVAKQNAAR